MSKIWNLSSAYVTFICFYLKASYIKSIENRFEFVQMFRKRHRPYLNIVYVHEAISPVHMSKDALHQTLKISRRVRQSKRHCCVLKMTNARRKSSLLIVIFRNWDVVITKCEIKCCEELSIITD